MQPGTGLVTLPVSELQQQNGILGNGASAGAPQGPPGQISLQNLLQNNLVQVSTASGLTANQNNMVQLQIPGHVTLSVNLNEQGGASAQPTQGVLVTSQAAAALIQQKPQTIMTSLGKIIATSSTGNPVVLQQAGAPNNFIQLPQQPNQQAIKQQGQQAHLANNLQLKPGGGPQVLQVRSASGQPGQVYLQMPTTSVTSAGTQSIQIVRTMQGQGRTLSQPVPSPGGGQGQAGQQIVQLKSPPPVGMAPTPSPQTPGIPPSPSSSMTSPQSGVMVPPDSPLVAILPTGQQPDNNALLLAAAKQNPGGPPLNHAGASLKIRPQRKQSLK